MSKAWLVLSLVAIAYASQSHALGVEKTKTAYGLRYSPKHSHRLKSGGSGNGSGNNSQQKGSEENDCLNGGVKGDDGKCECIGPVAEQFKAVPAAYEGEHCERLSDKVCQVYGDCCPDKAKFCLGAGSDQGSNHRESAARPSMGGDSDQESDDGVSTRARSDGNSAGGDSIRVYLTMTTYNRVYQGALTILSVINSDTTNIDIVVHDDKSTKSTASIHEVFEDLQKRKLIHKFEVAENNLGFLKTRELLADNFLKDETYTHWIHMDDDLLFGPDTLQRAINDYVKFMNNKGLMFIFMNKWAKRIGPERGPLTYVPYAGAPTYLIGRETLKDIGNPYKGYTGEPEGSNLRFWKKLHEKGYLTMTQKTEAYAVQHTGNVDSVIFGKKPEWEDAWAQDPKTKSVLQVPPFNIEEVRQALKAKKLPDYIAKVNQTMKNKIKMPSHTSEEAESGGNSGGDSQEKASGSSHRRFHNKHRIFDEDNQ